ncbi:hypothetical protein PA598K_01429 [Paenibacillus sp. 598K]|uniref:hypothetical protein n=1 Tax=Paenibacillus sp. 598K TaxID=1117987 RepID=UPI000FF90093|nr:hypothetical protein [Paenibacillus sp. 598K]GBF73144.1 hypothetical protein PA598K_01429 [Paenibacillus sp. 598K]
MTNRDTAAATLGHAVESEASLPQSKGWVHERVEVHRTVVTKICRYYLKYTQRFRELRGAVKGCEICRTKFVDGEKFNLAFTSKGNKIVCQACTDTAEQHGTEVILWPKAIESTEIAKAVEGLGEDNHERD